MDKNKVIDRINKLLALANNHAAAPGEKENALEAASKLAAKFGLKIVKGNSTSSTLTKNQFFDYEFYVKCFDKKFLDLLFNILGAYSYKFMGGHYVKVWFKNATFDEVEFAKFYKKFVSVYYKELKKEKSIGNYWDRNSTRSFRDYFFACFETGFKNADSVSLVYFGSYILGANLYSIKNSIVKEAK